MIGDQRHVEKRRRNDFVFQHAGLVHVQAAGAKRNDNIARLDRDRATAFSVVISQMAAQRGKHVRNAQHQVLPRVRHRVFEIEHHAGGAGIQHFYN